MQKNLHRAQRRKRTQTIIRAATRWLYCHCSFERREEKAHRFTERQSSSVLRTRIQAPYSS
jgi:hypothetical protein